MAEGHKHQCFTDLEAEKMLKLSKTLLHPAPSAFQQMVTSGNVDLHSFLAFILGQKSSKPFLTGSESDFFTFEFARKYSFMRDYFPLTEIPKGINLLFTSTVSFLFRAFFSTLCKVLTFFCPEKSPG